MAKNLLSLQEYDFVGYNDTKPPELLPRGVLADALNCYFRTGEIVKRKGYTLIGNDVGNNPIQGLKGMEFANGTKEFLMVSNGLIYKWTGSGSWSALSGSYTLNTTGFVDIVIANNNAYFFDGTNTVPKYNGTTVSTVAAIPNGSMARWFHNQLNIAGISGSPNKVRTSEIGDPETYSGGASSNIDVNPNDGDAITGLMELRDELLVFKKYRVWAASGFGTAALTLANINERLTGFGALSHFSLINTGNDILYVGFLGDKPIIRSIQRTRYGQTVDAGIVSEGIEATMGGLNKGRLSQSAGFFDGRYAHFAFCNGASSTNNLVLTLDTTTLGKNNKGWSRHTGIRAAIFAGFGISTTQQMFFGEASSDTKVYVFDTSTSDNGTAINFSITSRRYGSSYPSLKKKHKWLYVFAKEVGDYDVTIDKSNDGFTYDNLGTLNLAGSGSMMDSIILDTSRLGSTDIKSERFSFMKDRSRYLQLKMYDDSASSVVTIRNWELLFQLKKAPIDA